ncbi:MAG TPA: hypothetical protein VK140_05215 [Ktedonobacteraceae bacterium]|nr:hypothetical protein [Ktedonobacteraceae bacterium]
MDLLSLHDLNKMVDDAVTSSVTELKVILPKESAEEQVRKIIGVVESPTSNLSIISDDGFSNQKNNK